MKKQYIIPSTITVVFQTGFICQAASPGGRVITNNLGLGNGGNQIGGDPD